ncbi:hypothetical protein D6T65_17515 [Arthrobacter frigidicola]|nr:hypothetical protein D6T65_17515 [Arthrobacter frigidicola]
MLLPQLIGLLAEAIGPSADIGVGAIELLAGLIRWALIPMGTTLIGTAVVIRVLASELQRSSETQPSGR